MFGTVTLAVGGWTMVGEFLIESRCRAGHTSSATFRGYTRHDVEEVARTLDDRCHWQSGAEKCGCRVAHVITALSEPKIRTSETKPSMPAVVVPRSRPIEVEDASSPYSSGAPPTQVPKPTRVGFSTNHLEVETG